MFAKSSDSIQTRLRHLFQGKRLHNLPMSSYKRRKVLQNGKRQMKEVMLRWTIVETKPSERRLGTTQHLWLHKYLLPPQTPPFCTLKLRRPSYHSSKLRT